MAYKQAVAPDASPFVGPEILVEMTGHIGQAELCVIANARHGIPFSYGVFCAQQLSAFISRQRVR